MLEALLSGSETLSGWGLSMRDNVCIPTTPCCGALMGLGFVERRECECGKKISWSPFRHKGYQFAYCMDIVKYSSLAEHFVSHVTGFSVADLEIEVRLK